MREFSNCRVVSSEPLTVKVILPDKTLNLNLQEKNYVKI